MNYICWTQKKGAKVYAIVTQKLIGSRTLPAFTQKKKSFGLSIVFEVTTFLGI